MKRKELLVNAKPILFNTEMVKAILEDRKTVTRRLVKRQHLLLADDCKHEMGFFDTGGNDWACRKLGCGIINTGKSIYHAPYQVGDILYVRETWKPHDYTLIDGVWSCSIEYKVGESLTRVFWKDGEDSIYENINWKPSIHMPKEAARIFLKVTNVRVERLQEITSKEAIKEGLKDKYAYGEYNSMEPKKLFIDLWNSTINKQDLDEYGWEANPYVWVIEFERISYEN